MKNDYELVRWPPDTDKDKSAGIVLAGEEEENDIPDPAQVSCFSLHVVCNLTSRCIDSFFCYALLPYV